MVDTKIALSIACFAVVVLIIVHHFLICGRLFDLSDMLHHEFFWAIFLAFGLGLVSNKLIGDN